MNWDDLRFFLALAREGTVSGAGRALEVKHTTVARRIAALEEQLGSRLFDRKPSGYVLTQVGENLLPHSVSVEELVNSVDREVFGMDTVLKGSLKLASSYDILTSLVTPHLHHFTKKYPDIELDVISSTGLVDLRNREADIALRLSPSPPEYLVGRKILKLGYGVYASAKYLKTKRTHEDLVLWGSEKSTPDWVTRHFPKGKVRVRASEVMTMLDAIKNHHGLARMPCYVAEGEPSLRRLDLPLKPSKWDMWILSHPDLKSTARVRACKDFLIETVEKQHKVIEGTDSNYY